jgi:hypothetical protein
LKLTVEDAEQALVQAAIEWAEKNAKAQNYRDLILSLPTRRAVRLTERADKFRQEELHSRNRLYKLSRCVALLKQAEIEHA